MLELASGATPVFSRAFLGVGMQGHGQLDILAGGKVRLEAAVASGSFGVNVGGNNSVGPSSHGVLNIDGVGSELRLTGLDPSTAIGRNGTGVMTITHGGRLIVEDTTSTNATAFVGRAVGSSGTVHVSGADSLWQVGRQLRIGQESGGAPGGTGIVDVSDGGTIRAVVVRTGASNAGIGGGTLMGNGTVIGNIVNQGKLAPGNSPGALSVYGDVTLDPVGLLEIDMAGTGIAPSQFDQLNVFDNPDTSAIEGRIVLGGRLNVVLGGGFAPSAGDTFNVLTALDIVEQNPPLFELPSLGGGLQWEHALVDLGNGREALRLTVTAVPEPGTMALFAAGLAVVLGRRRLGAGAAR